MLLADFSVFATGAYLSSLNPFLLLLIGDAKLYFPPGVDISGAFLELEGAFFLFLLLSFFRFSIMDMSERWVVGDNIMIRSM